MIGLRCGTETDRDSKHNDGTANTSQSPRSAGPGALPLRSAIAAERYRGGALLGKDFCDDAACGDAKVTLKRADRSVSFSRGGELHEFAVFSRNVAGEGFGLARELAINFGAVAQGSREVDEACAAAGAAERFVECGGPVTALCCSPGGSTALEKSLEPRLVCKR